MFHISLKSSNAKTGKIPVTTTGNETCPTACPFKEKGCYAKSGPMLLHWNKVSNGERGMSTVDDFCDIIKSLPEGQLWRHNQAGDLPGKGNTLNITDFKKIVRANKGKRGFTYTHKPLKRDCEKKAVKWSNEQGFTVNLSGNNPAHADKLADMGIGPVVTVLSDTVQGRQPDLKTPNGRKIIVCPATYKDNVSCEKCKLCAHADRGYVIGFPAHGTSKKAVNQIAGS